MTLGEQQSLVFDDDGAVLRDQGMQRASEHAESTAPGWQDRALEFVRSYPQQEFMTEDVREYAYSHGLPRPPHERA